MLSIVAFLGKCGEGTGVTLGEGLGAALGVELLGVALGVELLGVALGVELLGTALGVELLEDAGEASVITVVFALGVNLDALLDGGLLVLAPFRILLFMASHSSLDSNGFDTMTSLVDVTSFAMILLFGSV